MPERSLLTPLRDLPGVGPKRAEALDALGLTRVGHLLAHLPLRHERHEPEAPIATLADGQIVTARGLITAMRAVARGRRPRVEAVLCDETGRLDLVWFNAPYMKDRVEIGCQARVQGKARRRGPGLQVANPTIEILRDDAPAASVAARDGPRLRPVYPASEALTSREIERLMGLILDWAIPLVIDHLDDDLRRSRALVPLAEAYRAQHAPRDEDEALASRRRLAYDELFLLQLGIHLKRARVRATLAAPPLAWSEAIDRHIRERFPFELTAAQREAIEELGRDLARPSPANRLVQGDVGSGKTVVALAALLLAIARGHQGTLMAPTEVLAEQHHSTIGAMLKGSRVRVELLTGSTPRGERESILSRLERGEVDLLIGTHALLTESVRFHSLALAVIDEQHRFGVHQRSVLRTKGEPGSAPHIVVMTATPIPRSIALTLFGDLDVTTIRGLPPGRSPIQTHRFLPADRSDAYELVRERLARGEQAYVVVPSIDGGPDDAEIESVRGVMERLQSRELLGFHVAALHARLRRATREHVMERFRLRAIHALVATTVIEVGVDVPNATVMVIEDADRFGLAQLHQLRGRVGRGTTPSLCLAIADPKTEDAENRLASFAASTDGFALAERDLELRGFGDVYGTRQSGLPPFKVADLPRDLDLLRLAKEDAGALIERSPSLAEPRFDLLRRRLVKAYGPSLGLVDVG